MNKKRSKTGTCKLCKKEKIGLTKAHLISKSQVKAACQNDNESKNVYTLNDVLRGYAPQDGWFDFILCAQCNNNTLCKYEKILSEFLNIHSTPLNSAAEESVNMLLQKTKLKSHDLYGHIKLAILSYFYQLEVAKVPYKHGENVNFFKQSIPPEDLENIRQMILENNAGEKTQYPVRISYAVPNKSIFTTDQSINVRKEDPDTVVMAITIDIFKLELFITPGIKEAESLCQASYDYLFRNILSVDTINQPLNDRALWSIGMRNAIVSSKDRDNIIMLFERGKNDSRELRNNPDHPINILKNLASLSPEKPNVHYQVVCECAFEILAQDDSCDNKYTPFDFICELMKAWSWSVASQNTNIKLQSKINYVNKESLTNIVDVQFIRKEIIDRTLALLSTHIHSKARKAAAFLIHCITFSDNLECPFTKEAEKTLDILIELLAQKKISDSLVYKQIAEIVKGLPESPPSIEIKLAKVLDYVCNEDA